MNFNNNQQSVFDIFSNHFFSPINSLVRTLLRVLIKGFYLFCLFSIAAFMYIISVINSFAVKALEYYETLLLGANINEVEAYNLGFTEPILDRFLSTLGFLYTLVTGPFARIAVYFSLFIISFSYFVSAQLSNEYLLFTCIIFTIFLLYGQIRDFLAVSLSGDIEAFRVQLCKKLELLKAIVTIQEDSLNSQLTFISVLEELAVYVSELDHDLSDYDSITYDVLLENCVSDSLFRAVSLELEDDFQEAFLILNDTYDEALEDLIGQLFE